MQIQISLPTRTLLPTLNKIVEEIIDIRRQGIDLAKQTFKIKTFDFNNPFHVAAAADEVEEKILSKYEHNAMYLGTIKAKKDLSNKYVKLNFFLLPSSSHNAANAEAKLDYLEVLVTTRLLFKDYEEILGTIFHEIKHFLQANEPSKEYYAMLPTFKGVLKQTDKENVALIFSKYHTDIAEFETTLTEIVTTIYYKFLRLRKSSGEEWKDVRTKILNGLYTVINSSAHEMSRNMPDIFPQKTIQFFKSISLAEQPEMYWSLVKEHLAKIYKKLSNTW